MGASISRTLLQPASHVVGSLRRLSPAGVRGEQQLRRLLLAAAGSLAVVAALTVLRRTQLTEPPSAVAEDARVEASENEEEDEVDAEHRRLEAKVLKAVDRVLDDWFVTSLHRAALKKFIKDKVCAGSSDCDRVRQWLMLRINNKIWDHGQPMMCRVPDNVPGLRSMEVWSRDALPWLPEIEAYHKDILAELFAAGPNGFQPYREPIGKESAERAARDGVGAEAVDSGSWNVLYLFLNHKRFEENCEKLPVTVNAIQKAFPRHYSHAFISALSPGTHILKHHGPCNRMLRIWLPLSGLEGFRLRVGSTIIEPNAGEAFGWDHSFEHEAWHTGSETRFVLIVDIWHPDLSPQEIKFLGAMQNCRLRAARAIAEQSEAERTAPEDASYFEIVERARKLLTDDDWWVVRAEKDPTTRPT
eukprot:TRINITY_DN47727_c0_g1_i1.p1 TRINITY_DN47727_c0_g1~~TRINITY_DN47727_c0_g1_i1.p1  ORF type:complete len:443 (-),score=97.67 TRINITY_DN47727_c0_g1_i1:277-1524(-)